MDTSDTVGEHHDSHCIYPQEFVSFFCSMNPVFSNMSKRAGESFATSASAKQKPVHCSAMIARKMFDKNATWTIYHAVPPPEYQAGGVSKRENLCQQDSERVTRIVTEA